MSNELANELKIMDCVTLQQTQCWQYLLPASVNVCNIFSPTAPLLVSLRAFAKYEITLYLNYAVLSDSWNNHLNFSL